MSRPTKNTTVLFVPHDEDKPVEKMELRPGLDAIYELVAPETRLFECVRGNTMDLYGDEEALLHGEPWNRINARAMQLLGHDMQKGIEEFTSPLVGDFIALGLPTSRGNQSDAPAWVFDFKFTWTARKVGQ